MKPAWYLEAEKLVGMAEIPGPRHNPEVVQLFADAGHPGIKDDETAWCAAMTGATLRRSRMQSSGSLAARSYQNFGERVDQVKLGSIVVLSRGNHPWQGHVGYATGKVTATHIELLSGNAKNRVGFDPYPLSRVLAYRWPVDKLEADPDGMNPVPYPVIDEPTLITTTSLNFRVRPDRGANIIGVMPPGAEVADLDCWRRVRFEGRIGWAHADYLEKT